MFLMLSYEQELELGEICGIVNLFGHLYLVGAQKIFEIGVKPLTGLFHVSFQIQRIKVYHTDGFRNIFIYV